MLLLTGGSAMRALAGNGNLSDPAAIVLSIAEDRLQKAGERVTEERAKAFINVESVISTVSEYGKVLQSKETEIRLFSIPEDSARSMQMTMQKTLFSGLSVEETAASTIISRLAGHSGYRCLLTGEARPAYAAAAIVSGELRAVLLFSVNGHAAVTNMFYPVLKNPFASTEEEMTAFFDKCVPVDLPDLSGEEKVRILEELKHTVGIEKTAEELAVELASQIAARAKDDDPVILTLPEDVQKRAFACRVYGEKPSRVLCLSGETLSLPDVLKESIEEQASGFSEEELQKLMLSAYPSQVMGHMGDVELAAVSTMSAETTAALAGTEDQVYLLVYETGSEDPYVCYVSVILNENGCFDLTAVPMLNGPLTTRFLQVAETGVFPWPAE